MTDHISDRNRGTNPFQQECGFCDENLEAHALGALSATDRARMERHLQWCGPCRRALARIHEVTDLLPLAVDVATPRPTAKASLFERIAAESRSEEPVVNFGNPWEGQVTPSAPAVTPSKPGAPMWRSGWAAALVAPLAIALIILGAWTSSLRNDIDSLQAQQNNGFVPNVEANVSQNQLRLYSMEPSCPECDETPASGHLGGNPEDNVGILVAWNLNPNEEHQIWCEKRDGEVMLVSDLQVEQSGDIVQTVNFPDAIGGYSTIYVTRHDGTEEMRVALNHENPVVDSTPVENVPNGN